MCGIVGIMAFHAIDSNKRKSFMQQGLIASSLRGVDGTGVFFVPHDPSKEEIVILKKPMPSPDFVGLYMNHVLFRDIEKYKFVVGHTRAKTRGDIKIAHTHPFQHGHITMVHNGSITNGYNLAGNTFFDVDSEAICKALSEAEDPKAVLSKIDGAYALVWHDAKEDALYMARNDERPLFYGVSKDGILVFASEMKMLDWISWRSGIDLVAKYDVGEHRLLKFTDSIKPKLQKYAKIVAAPLPIWDGPNYAGGQGRFYPPAARNTSSNYSFERTMVYGNTADTYLKDYGLTNGQIIEFGFDSWQMRTTKSRHGRLSGMYLKDPFLEVEAAGCEYRPYGNETILSGKIMGVGLETEPSSRKVETILLIEPATVAEVIGKTSKSLLPKDYEAGTEEGKIVRLDKIGPLGLVSQDEYAKLIENGCDSCTGPIIDQDHDVMWTNAGMPICKTCQQFFGESGVLQ